MANMCQPKGFQPLSKTSAQSPLHHTRSNGNGEPGWVAVILSVFSDLAVGSRWFHLLSTTHALIFPSIPRSTAKSYWKNFLFFVQSKTFGARSRPNGGEFEGNDSRLLIVAKNSLKWYKYCLCLVTFWESHFSRQKCRIKLYHFTYRTNQYSKSKSETTPRLILTPQIQWWSQNLEMSFC